MRYLTFAEVLELHRRVVAETGGATALRDLGALESATAQPRASFGGNDLYPSLEEKAAALAFKIIRSSTATNELVMRRLKRFLF